MNDLIVVDKIARWQRLKALVLDSVSSPITKRVYNMPLDEFMCGSGRKRAMILVVLESVVDAMIRAHFRTSRPLESKGNPPCPSCRWSPRAKKSH